MVSIITNEKSLTHEAKISRKIYFGEMSNLGLGFSGRRLLPSRSRNGELPTRLACWNSPMQKRQRKKKFHINLKVVGEGRQSAFSSPSCTILEIRQRTRQQASTQEFANCRSLDFIQLQIRINFISLEIAIFRICFPVYLTIDNLSSWVKNQGDID